MATMQTYSFSEVTRDLTPILEMMQEQRPTALSLFSTEGNATAVKHEWYDYSSAPVESALAGDEAAGSGTVVVGEAVFTTGDLITFKDGSPEVFKITAAGTTLTLKNMAGDAVNTAYDHAAGTMVLRIAQPRLEGASPTETDGAQGTLLYNYTQIFEKAVKVSGTALAQRLNETPDAIVDYFVKQKLEELYRDMNFALIWGERYVGTSTVTRTLGGIRFWLTDTTHGTPISTNAAAAELTLKLIDDLNEQVFKAGGMPDTILCGTTTARKISKLARSLTGVMVTTERTDSTTGNYVASLQGDFVGSGLRRIVVDSGIPSGQMYLLDSSKLRALPLVGRQIQDIPRPETGDFILRDLIGEYTVQIQNPYNSHAMLFNFGVTL